MGLGVENSVKSGRESDLSVLRMPELSCRSVASAVEAAI